MSKSVIITALVLGLSTSASAEDDRWLTRSGTYRISFQSELDPITINRIHAWVLQVTTPEGQPIAGAKITATGGMPEHNHGLPTDPRMTEELGEGFYRFEGFRFHMNGQWELTLTIDVEGQRDTVVITLTI